MIRKIQLTLLSILTLCCTCITYITINKDNIKVNAKQTTIMLDAGHGGYDSGSVAIDDTLEKDYNLKIVKALGKILKSKGYNVVYTRTSDKVSWSDDNKEDLQARCDLAKSKNADYFISIHLNASNYYDDGASGYEIYCDFNNSKTKKLSKSILNQLDNLNYSTNRGLQDTNETSLYVVSKNTVPAILIEAGFITDSNDVYYIQNNTEQLAQAISKGISKSI